MSDDLGDLFGFVRADQAPEPRAPKRNLETLCALHGEDPAAIANELRKDTALARFVRKAFGFASELPKHEPKPLGRPTQDAQHRRDRMVVNCLLHEGATLEQAYELGADIRAEEGRRDKDGKAITPEGLRSAVRRRPKSVGDLYGQCEVPIVDGLSDGLARLKRELEGKAVKKRRRKADF